VDARTRPASAASVAAHLSKVASAQSVAGGCGQSYGCEEAGVDARTRPASAASVTSVGAASVAASPVCGAIFGMPEATQSTCRRPYSGSATFDRRTLPSSANPIGDIRSRPASAQASVDLPQVSWSIAEESILPAPSEPGSPAPSPPKLDTQPRQGIRAPENILSQPSGASLLTTLPTNWRPGGDPLGGLAATVGASRDSRGFTLVPDSASEDIRARLATAEGGASSGLADPDAHCFRPVSTWASAFNSVATSGIPSVVHSATNSASDGEESDAH